MNFKEHCDHSRQELGSSGEIYHKWMDQYFEQYGDQHRAILHHREGIEIGVQIFGEAARPFLELHVRDDYLLSSNFPIYTITQLRGWRKSKGMLPKPEAPCLEITIQKQKQPEAGVNITT